MKAKITNVIDDCVEIMNFNTLEELLAWREKNNESIIIGSRIFDDDNFDLYKFI